MPVYIGLSKRPTHIHTCVDALYPSPTLDTLVISSWVRSPISLNCRLYALAAHQSGWNHTCSHSGAPPLTQDPLSLGERPRRLP